MDDQTYNKLTDQDDKSSSNQDIQFTKGFRQKFFDQPQKTSSSKFINPRKDVALKSAREEQRMKKVQSIYTDAFKVQPKMSQSKKTLNQQASKAYKNERQKKWENTAELIISKKGVNLEDMYYQKSQVLVGKQMAEALQIQQLGGFRRYSQMNKEKKKVEKVQEEKKKQDLKASLQAEIEKLQNMIDGKRRKQLQSAKQILSGKISIIWIFVISKELAQYEKSRIFQMYSGLSEQKCIVPLCRVTKQIKPFLQVPNTWFKIVSDLANIAEVIKYKINQKVVQFYIYNDKGEYGISQSLKYKTQIKKVKGIYTKLEKIIDRAQDQIQNEVQLFQLQNGISVHKNLRKFPSFLKLSGEDKTEATKYRSNLYGARNLSEKQKPQRFKDFIFLVIERYSHLQKQRQNIVDYRNIDHSIKIQAIEQARKILQFYVRQSFYYQLLNTMLRTMKTSQEFRSCILPFNQTYHSIKLFYNNQLTQTRRKIKAQTLYRGAIIRQKDFKMLKPNVYIQMFGFMSTSKNFQRATDFTDELGYIFVIHVPEMTILKKYEPYDHGFVDINQHNLASSKFAVEEEVLFNALNIYRVRNIQKTEKGYTLIHIEYGVIFDLLSKKRVELNDDERDVLLNYQYSVEMLSKIEDLGDVHLIFNQFQESKNYYQSKINEDQNSGKFYYKLANVQQQCGQLEEADKNAQLSLELQLRDLDATDKQNCLKVFSIHSKNAQISLQKEDYLYADDALSEAIQLLDDDNLFQKGKKFRERGEIKFKKGQIINAQKDFQKSEEIFKQISQKGQQKKKEINKNYFFSYLTLFCSSQTKEDMEAEKQDQLKEIQVLQTQIANMKQNINDELIKVNKSMKDVAQYVEDKEKYEISIKKARSYLIQIQSRKTKDPHEKARLKVLQATVQDYLELAQSQKLLNEAIKLVQSTDPYNEDVGKYSTILAELQKQDLQKFSNPKCMMKAKLQKSQQPIPFNEQEHRQVYTKCKGNYEKAINVLLYHNKSTSSPQVMNLKNQLGQLDYNQCNLEDSYRIIKQVKESAVKNKTDHTQVSKSCLLLSKISFSRGQLKNSFQNIQESKKILKNAIVKKQEDKYYKIYHSNDTYLQIKLHRAKIYLRQLNHDLSLKDISQVKQYLNVKLKQQQFHSLLADAYEIQAQNLGSNKQMYEFDQYFQKAIKLREKQIGVYNIANAVAYCNYAKFLIVYKDIQGATKALTNAIEIFSCFSQDHPITWLVFYCSGLIKSMKSHNEQCLSDFQNCLKLAYKKYDKSHITVNKLRLQFGKQLEKFGKVEQAIKQYEQLEDDLQDNLRASHSRRPIYEQTDDQKVTVQKILYQSLQSFYKQMEQNKQKQMRKSLSNYYGQKITDLRKTYNIESGK